MMRPIFTDRGDGSYLVGAEDPSRKYRGPLAEVFTRDCWLYIETDPYEGVAMLNIEALDSLIDALSAIKARLAATEPKP